MNIYFNNAEDLIYVLEKNFGDKRPYYGWNQEQESMGKIRILLKTNFPKPIEQSNARQM
jgi:hypothetical protein